LLAFEEHVPELLQKRPVEDFLLDREGVEFSIGRDLLGSIQLVDQDHLADHGLEFSN
jgi:hypothetical protein